MRQAWPQTGPGHRRGEAIGHHPSRTGGSRRRKSHRRLGAARHADRRRARRDARRLDRNPVLSHAAGAYRRRSRRPDPCGSPGRPLGRRVQRPPTPHDDGGAPARSDAVAAAVDELRGTGAELVVRPSPWRLGAAHADLTAEWFGGWAAAACEQEPALATEARAYRDRAWRRLPLGARRHRRPSTCWCCRRPLWTPGAAPRAAARGGGRDRPPPPGRSPYWSGSWARAFLDGVRAVDGGALAAACGLAVLTTVLRLALEDRGPWPRHRPAAGSGGGRLLPLAVPQSSRCPAGWWATSTAGSATAATPATSAAGCAPWRGSARRQVVQAVVTVAVLLVVPSPVRATMPLVARSHCSRRPASRWLRGPPSANRGGRGGAAPARELRDGLLAWRAWPAIALASALVVAGHAVTFLIAARAAGRPRRRPSCFRWRCSCCWPGRCPTSAAGAARGRDGLGVRRRRPGRVSRGRHCGRLRRDGVRRQPAGRRRAPGGLARGQSGPARAPLPASWGPRAPDGAADA